MVEYCNDGGDKIFSIHWRACFHASGRIPVHAFKSYARRNIVGNRYLSLQVQTVYRSVWERPFLALQSGKFIDCSTFRELFTTTRGVCDPSEQNTLDDVRVLPSRRVSNSSIFDKTSLTQTNANAGLMAFRNEYGVL